MSNMLDFEAAFRWSPDVCALLDADGRIAAVNDAWTSLAVAASASGSTGLGADYLAVCRRGARHDAPRAREAYLALTDVMLRRRTTASVSYPCTLPSGVRWWRAEFYAVGRSGLAGTRHVDITADLTAGPTGVTVGLMGDVSPVLTEAALELAVRDAFDGPTDPAVLVLVTDFASPRNGVVRPGELDAVRAATAYRIRNNAAVDVVAGVGVSMLAVLVTAEDHLAAMRTADAVIDVTSATSSGPTSQWGIAARTSSDTAATLLARARHTLAEAVGHDTGRAAYLEAADRSYRLHAAAEDLVPAVAAFDVTLSQGVAMARLADLDRAVAIAERACVAAADTYRRG